jgi:hypothetical protein
MEYHFSAVAKPTHLHVIGTGTHSADNLRRLFADTERARLENQLDSVLIELRFVGPSLNVGGLYAIMIENQVDASRLRGFALVDTNTEHLPERKEFVELASHNMGINFRPFRTVADAEKWLIQLFAVHEVP